MEAAAGVLAGKVREEVKAPEVGKVPAAEDRVPLVPVVAKGQPESGAREAARKAVAEARSSVGARRGNLRRGRRRLLRRPVRNLQRPRQHPGKSRTPVA